MSLTPAVLEARVVKAEAVDEPVLLLPGEARDLLELMRAAQAYRNATADRVELAALIEGGCRGPDIDKRLKRTARSILETAGALSSVLARFAEEPA